MVSSIAHLGRSMWVLLAGVFAFHAGWYVLLPFLAIIMTDRRGLEPAQVGLLLASHSLTLLVGSLLGGLLADRFGRKPVMVVGLILRAAGIGLLGVAPGFLLLLASAGVAGFGGGLYGPAAKAAISVLATDAERTAAFSLRGVAANLGVSLGPLLGSLLVGGAMLVLFGAGALLHVVLAIVTWLFLGSARGEERQVEATRGNILRDVPYVMFSLVMVGAWALYAQLAISLPLYANAVLGLEASVGLLWTISSMTVIVLQLAVSRMVAARLHPFTAMAAGVVLIGGGLGAVGLARGFGGLVAALLLFVLGQMLMVPTADSAVALMARGGAVGSYFGMASFAWGLGEGAGALIGGGLMQYSFRTGRLALPWVVYGAAGLVLGGLLYGLRRWNRIQSALQDATSEGLRRVQQYRPGYPVTQEDGVLLGPNDDSG